MVFSSTIQHLVAGTAGGLFSTAALYPLELIKTRMQVIDTHDHLYRHFLKSFRTVLREEGVRGLYQGMTPALFAASGSWGGYFYFYEKIKSRKLGNKQNEVEGTQAPVSLGTFDHLLSGIEAGSMMVFIFNPLWVVKTRLALQGAEAASSSHRHYSGMLDALQTIAKEEGVRGLYKGLVPALLLTSHGAIQFAIYEQCKKFASSFRSFENKDSQPAWVSLLLGGSSKIIAATVTYPYQVVKSRLQQRDLAECNKDASPNTSTQTAKRYNGTVDCIVKMWRREGVSAFFRGVLPNALKVAPSAAVTFVVYEEAMKIMKTE